VFFLIPYLFILIVLIVFRDSKATWCHRYKEYVKLHNNKKFFYLI